MLFMNRSASRSSLTVWTARTNVLDVCTRGREKVFSEVRVLLYEWWNLFRETQRVITNQHLTIALRSGADSDGGNLHGTRDTAGQIRRNGLEHNGKNARRLEHLCILDEAVCGI